MRALKFVIAGILGAVVFGFVVMYLWNWLMPGLFGLKIITYWQSVGLIVLSKMLFGGPHFHGGRGGGRGWKRHMKKRFANMTPEEIERFRAGMRGRGCRWDTPTPPAGRPEQSAS